MRCRSFLTFVELHFFGSHSVHKLAEARDVTQRIVHREWQKVRLILLEALS